MGGRLLAIGPWCEPIFVIVFSVGLLSVSFLVEGTGISTHIEVAERSQEYLDLITDGVDYRRLIKMHPGSFEAGQPYPDAYFPRFCQSGALHYVSEDTHWTPFVNTTVNYIRKTYPKPWSRDTEKLVVFLLGIVEHHIADVKWHGQRTDQGFLTTMANVNYHGSFSAAHLDGDVGADVINQFALDMSYIGLLPTKWYIPTEDLANIYFDYYGDGRITEEIITNCSTILFLERFGENIGALELVYPFWSRRSPFLTERLQDYFQGGVDDMAVWTNKQWHETVYMLDHGTDDCYMPYVFLWARCNQTATARDRTNLLADSLDGAGDAARRRIANNMVHIENILEHEDIVVETTGRGVEMSLTLEAEERVRELMSDYTDYQRAALNETEVTYPSFVYTTKLPYSRLGESLITEDLNGDGHLDLVAGAPGYSSGNNLQRGRVYIVFGTINGLPNEGLILENDAHLILEGPKPSGRFGQSLAVLDYNHDGHMDLVVGAPTTGTDTLEYQGAAYIFYGNGQGGYSAEPSLTVTCTDYFCNLGWSVSTGDLNNDGYADLVIGAPFAPSKSGGEQRGFVGVLYSKSAGSGATCPATSEYGICEMECISDGDCSVAGKCCFNGCGFSCFHPTVSNSVVYMTEDDFDWIAEGTQDFEWFGWSTIVSKPVLGSTELLIGSPTFRKCVSPDCDYHCDDVQSVGRYSVYRAPLTAEPHTTVEGNDEMGQLGYYLAEGDIGGQHVILAASSSQTMSGIQNGTDTDMNRGGYVRVWPSHSHGGDPLYTLAGDRQHARFGYSIKLLDIDGDGTRDVIIGAPHRSVSRMIGREAGHVFVFNGNDRDGQVDGENAEWKLSLDEAKSRFGTAVSAVPRGIKKAQVLASAPHSNFDSRMGGRIAIFDLN